MNKKIVMYLLKDKVKPHYKGFNYLCEAIELTIANDCVLPSIGKELYSKIAKKHDETISGVERTIRNAIHNSDNAMSNAKYIVLAALNITLDEMIKM